MAWQLQRFPATTPAVALAARAGAIVLALVVSGVIVGLHGADPLALGAQVIRSTFGSRFGLQDFGLLVTPLILCGLAVAVTLRIGIWNIGAEGQFAMGALATTAVGIFVTGPPPVMLVVLFIAGALGGLLWILLPTLARAYVGVNELITTLLLNFVAALAVYYVSTGPWRDKASGMTASTFKVPYVVPPALGDAALRHRDSGCSGGFACRGAGLHPLGLRGAPQRRQSGSRALCRHPGPPADHRRDAHFRRHCRASPACSRSPAPFIGCRAASPTISAMSASWSRSWRAAPASA